MYNYRKNHRHMPSTIGGLFENALSNDWNKMFYDDNWSNVTAPVNIKETEQAYLVDVIAPGLKKEDFKISVEKDTLHITFEQEEEKKESTDKVLRSEYKFRSFKRSFSLSEKVNASNITAKYTDGVLSVNLPKKENAEEATKTISVN